MNNTEISPTDSSSNGVSFRLVLLLLVAVVLFGLAGCFRMSSDASALKETMFEVAAQPRETTFQMRLGAIPFALARAGLRFVPCDPHARVALASMRGAEVGVYQLRDSWNVENRGKVLNAAEQLMSRRGWDCIIKVTKGEQLVTIFAPKRSRSDRLDVCLVVLEKDKMVIASAKTRLEGLIQMAFAEAEGCDLASLKF